MLKKHSKIYLLLLLITPLFFSCSDDETDTVPKAPTLTTAEVQIIDLNKVISGGKITSNGGAEITAKGICWSTQPNPDISLTTKTEEGAGDESFTSEITQLTYGTRYYIKAYATNEIGTSYGNEVTFVAGAPFDELDQAITNKMNTYNIPSVSVAIVKNEKLVYLQSYGYSDIEANQTADNSDLYRIASISKPITLTVLLKLIQDGLITMDQTVFGSNGILGNDYGEVPIGSNKELITIRHLIEHTSGWTNDPYDPMFSPINITQQEIISDILTNRPLTYSPGTTYYYSNFGYCVLGRVIEKVTGETYENYVKTNILNPMGITEMKIGGNTLEERFPNEVKYYQAEYSPYIMNVTRMDSHGGWIASAKDLAKFITRIDRNSNIPDIIQTPMLNQTYFGYDSWAFFGSLPGTSTIINRLNNDFSFIVLTNTRTYNDPDVILEDLNQTVGDLIKTRSEWPEYDLF